MDAIVYVVRTCCSWRQLPADFPPWQTAYGHFVRWEDQVVTQRILDVLRRRIREKAGRDSEPSAAVIDSQSVKGADTLGAGTRGYDASKKINGRKRFVATDTLGLLLTVMARPAGVQDRAGATSPSPRPWTCTDIWSRRRPSGRGRRWATPSPPHSDPGECAPDVHSQGLSLRNRRLRRRSGAEKADESACRPGFVLHGCEGATIHLGPALPPVSSGLPARLGRAALKRRARDAPGSVPS
ncbi:hypothetical protein GCM10017600_74440 [Streptosporangium carneum]|uniref:Transposase IS4-like domain-containing protein n=1 Tax=Streptosporangium carneum TaxID=47481 RepID=A0A9W6I932_9ACTN|nr:hypothetical protein GCM10017600_74440 [Streptosporangium carneum]